MARSNVGGEGVFFDRYNVMSYGMARLKAGSWNKYRGNDNRLYWNRDPKYRRTEADLRAELSEGGNHHKYVVEGGWWWENVRIWTAERDGETELAAELRAKRDREFAAFTVVTRNMIQATKR